MASRRPEQQSELRLKVLRLISKNPEMSSRRLADEVGISNGSAYYVLNALVEKGLVKLENLKNNPSKGRYTYLLTPEGVHEKSMLTHNFIERKRREYNYLKNELETLEEEVKLIVKFPSKHLIEDNNEKQ